ncbi:hypothetical protein DFA_12315 [Cavenderia fasciculata]|uniref:Uncharacterized protein n=1 Tax=Cavenderia fasciculata TaxID=261658 RepID=F4QD68_CACFS|nr:uncharacterized protein DFA_12315 [Cavenderia fasciculata]EGG14539.1 hypothetical protein DFA_12315 [Cavenderia fasciculata]|eukprot:XP_004353981.1 hypothetical protein DFA_12315 [Cavenderia fasciculata]
MKIVKDEDDEDYEEKDNDKDEEVKEEEDYEEKYEEEEMKEDEDYEDYEEEDEEKEEEVGGEEVGCIKKVSHELDTIMTTYQLTANASTTADNADDKSSSTIKTQRLVYYIINHRPTKSGWRTSKQSLAPPPFQHSMGLNATTHFPI